MKRWRQEEASAQHGGHAGGRRTVGLDLRDALNGGGEVRMQSMEKIHLLRTEFTLIFTTIDGEHAGHVGILAEE